MFLLTQKLNDHRCPLKAIPLECVLSHSYIFWILIHNNVNWTEIWSQIRLQMCIWWKLFRCITKGTWDYYYIWCGTNRIVQITFKQWISCCRKFCNECWKQLINYNDDIVDFDPKQNAHQTFLHFFGCSLSEHSVWHFAGIKYMCKSESEKGSRCACETIYCRWWIQYVILNICSKLFDRPLIMSNGAEHCFFNVRLDRQWNEIRYAYIYNWSNVMCYVPYMQMFLISKTATSFVHHYQRLKWCCLAHEKKNTNSM